MFGRRTTPESPATTTSREPNGATSLDAAGSGGGKGRPTPKRREAERQRRQRVAPPANRKEARRRMREEMRVERARQREGLVAGDPRFLPRRDQGPARAHVRDYIDRRRNVGEYLLMSMVAILVISLVAGLLGAVAVQAAAVYLWPVLIALLAVDAVVIARTLRRELSSRYPPEQRKGAVAYGIMRSTQMRRMRLPKPRVERGSRS